EALSEDGRVGFGEGQGLRTHISGGKFVAEGYGHQDDADAILFGVVKYVEQVGFEVGEEAPLDAFPVGGRLIQRMLEGITEADQLVLLVKSSGVAVGAIHLTTDEQERAIGENPAACQEL